MDRPAVQRPPPHHAWTQPYPPVNHTYTHPLTAQYPPHDQHDPYPAPGLYPTVVSQQIPHMHRNSYPVPGTLIPGGPGNRPRGQSTVGSNSSYFDQPAPPFPAPAAPNFPQVHAFPHIPVPSSNPPALQHQPSGYGFPQPNQTQDVPIRPSPMFTRRSSSTPAVGRAPAPEIPPPIPPLPPNYQSSNHQHAPPRLSPAPPPSIPIPSPSHSHRTDSSPLYDSPYDSAYESAPPPFPSPPQPRLSSAPQFPTTSSPPNFESDVRRATYDNAPPPFSAPPQHRAESPPQFPTTSSPPKFESDVKHAPVDEEEEAFKMAIALSQKESMENSGMLSQEDDDLRRAIEESIMHASSFGIPLSPSEAGPSTFPKTTSPLSVPSPLPVAEPSVRPHTPHASSSTSHVSASRPASKVSSPTIRPAQPNISDEALAQRLAEEEEMVAAAGPSNPKPESPVLMPEITIPPAPAPSSTSRRRQESDRPKFTVVNADSGHSAASRKHLEATQSMLAINNSNSELPPPMYNYAVSAQKPAPAPTSPTFPNRNASFGRSTSASVVMPSSSRLSPIHDPADGSNLGRSHTLGTVSSSSSSAGPSLSVSTTPSSPVIVEESPNPLSGQPPGSPGGPTPNSFIDQQLLYGVCKSPLPPRLHKMWGVVIGADSFPLKRSDLMHLRSPASRRR